MCAGPFDLVLCRNVAFTYFDAPVAREELPGDGLGLAPDPAGTPGVYVRRR